MGVEQGDDHDERRWCNGRQDGEREKLAKVSIGKRKSGEGMPVGSLRLLILEPVHQPRLIRPELTGNLESPER